MAGRIDVDSAVSLAEKAQSEASNLTGLPEGWSLVFIIERLRGASKRLSELADAIESRSGSLDEPADTLYRLLDDLIVSLANGENGDEVALDAISDFAIDAPEQADAVARDTDALADSLDDTLEVVDTLRGYLADKSPADDIRDTARKVSDAVDALVDMSE